MTSILSYFNLVALFMLNLSCQEAKPDPEIHLIPEGLRGKVIIQFDQTNSSPVSYENHFRVYKIPGSGTLNTSSKINLGIKNPTNSKFYLIDGQGNRKPLPHYDSAGLHPDDIVVSNLYVVGNSFQYFVDELRHIQDYKNPAIDENSRQ